MVYKIEYGEDFCQGIAVIPDGKGILICNYRVELTLAEHTIVAFLFERGTWTDRKEISSVLSVKEKSIPVHVSNINKKARMVSGRGLIEGNRSGEYRVFPNP